MEPQQQQRRRGRPRVVVTEAVLEQRSWLSNTIMLHVEEELVPPSLRDQLVDLALLLSLTLQEQGLKHLGSAITLTRENICLQITIQFWTWVDLTAYVASVKHLCGMRSQLAGKVQLPFLLETPPELFQLLASRGREGDLFHRLIRTYNNIFAFVPFGGDVDNSVNVGRGPYVFRVRGLTYHSPGSLDPPPGCTPKFAQIYMYDGQEALQYRLQFPGHEVSLDPSTISSLSEMLNRENELVEIFKQIRERFHESEQTPVRVRLLVRRVSDGRYVNLPTQNDYEFAGLVLDNDFVNKRDIVVQRRSGGVERITNLHPCFMSLQYSLLFPRGENGYRLNIKHRNVDASDNSRNKTVSSREYYAFRFQYRKDEGHTLLLGGRLFLQFVVDAWCSVERGRLQWVRENQSIIRSDLYNNIVDSVGRGDVAACDVGKHVVLPSSFTGGYRHMQQNFQDSLAICKEYGHPDLFITFTCNPKWEEIKTAVELCGSRDASVRPDIVARVFKLKLDAMMTDLTKNNVLGRVLAVVYTVEFKKRGLPHAHIVLWLADADKLKTPEDIDDVICAEISDKETNPVGYNAVSQLMMHGPCGMANPKCPCMYKGRCTKHFPKPFNDATTVNNDGYTLYMRRDTKRTVECGNVHLDNRHVVPYNRGLLVKYQGHISVECCNRSQSIKYLFKYIGKDPDTATVVLETGDQSANDLLSLNSPYFLHSYINPGMKLVSLVFDGSTYGDWKRSMILSFSAKNKVDFVYGTIDKPELTNVVYKAWERCNSMLISWLLGVLEQHIARSVLYFTSTRDIWVNLEESCGTCTCTITEKLLKSQQDRRLIEFLMKLNEDFEVLRVNRRKFSDNFPPKNQPFSFRPGSTQSRSNNYFCDHRKILGHTIQRCHKLLGYHRNYKSDRRAVVAAHVDKHSDDFSQNNHSDNVTLTADQYKQLM